MTGQRIQQEAICYQWFKQRLILSVFKPSISQWSQIKEDNIEPSVLAREFNLKAHAAITWHNNPASLCLEPRLADHRSQAGRTATLPSAPPRQAGGTVDVIQQFDCYSLIMFATCVIARRWLADCWRVGTVLGERHAWVTWCGCARLAEVVRLFRNSNWPDLLRVKPTSSSAVAKRPRDSFYLSVVKLQ